MTEGYPTPPKLLGFKGRHNPFRRGDYFQLFETQDLKE
jgi:hypothetical protein